MQSLTDVVAISIIAFVYCNPPKPFTSSDLPESTPVQSKKKRRGEDKKESEKKKKEKRKKKKEKRKIRVKQTAPNLPTITH